MAWDYWELPPYAELLGGVRLFLMDFLSFDLALSPILSRVRFAAGEGVIRTLTA